MTSCGCHSTIVHHVRPPTQSNDSSGIVFQGRKDISFPLRPSPSPLSLPFRDSFSPFWWRRLQGVIPPETYFHGPDS